MSIEEITYFDSREDFASIAEWTEFCLSKGYRIDPDGADLYATDENDDVVGMWENDSRQGEQGTVKFNE